MRILFTRFPLESRFGGAEVQTLSLMKGLSEKGHEVGFLGSCPTLLKVVSATKLEIGPPPVTKWHAVSFAWRQFGMRRKLIEAFETCFNGAQHDRCIFMLNLSEKLLLTDWAVTNSIKVIWVEHDRVGRWLTKNPWLPKLRRLSKLTTTVVVSDLSKEIYEELGWEAERVVSIPNGIDVSKYASSTGRRVMLSGARSEAKGADEAQRRPSAQHDKFRVGCVARLTRDKGVDVLIDAVASLPNISLTIVGTGREEKNIRKLLEQTLVTGHWSLVTAHSDITDFYTSLDCLVLPSRDHDPFGIVAAEAMAAGVPVIVTDACGISRHLKPGEAVVVRAGNIETLRNALREVQKNDVWKQLSENGSRAARERFSEERMVGEYAKLMERGIIP